MQLVNIVAKPAEDETAVVTRTGTLDNPEQLLNMFDISVTAAVLNNGTVVNEAQPLNIYIVVLTAAVELPITTFDNL